MGDSIAVVGAREEVFDRNLTVLTLASIRSFARPADGQLGDQGMGLDRITCSGSACLVSFSSQRLGRLHTQVASVLTLAAHPGCNFCCKPWSRALTQWGRRGRGQEGRDHLALTQAWERTSADQGDTESKRTSRRNLGDVPVSERSRGAVVQCSPDAKQKTGACVATLCDRDAVSPMFAISYPRVLILV